MDIRFTAIKLPNLESDESDGTVYVYMDAKNSEWTYLTGITTEESAIGHTVAQMYSPSQDYNNVSFIIMIIFRSRYTELLTPYRQNIYSETYCDFGVGTYVSSKLVPIIYVNKGIHR